MRARARVTGLDPTVKRARRSPRDTARRDLLLVADMVESDSRVLDLGCGDGTLLNLLTEERGVDGRGLELSQKGVNECVAKGLPVIQGDADTDDAFDYVILSQTLQAVRRPKAVIENMLRIGRRAIVSFPNFAHWRVRWEVAARGRMPVTDTLSYSWYETPNIHFCSIRDFLDLARDLGATIEKAAVLDRRGRPLREHAPRVWNLFGQQAVFLLRR